MYLASLPHFFGYLSLNPSPRVEGLKTCSSDNSALLSFYFYLLSSVSVPKLHNIFTNDVKQSIAMIMPQII
jgi:hypothetical protein